MSHCNEFCPETMFNTFKLVQFPISLVGLSTTKDLNVEVNLDKDAYIKTTHNGRLMEFEKAREISASHRVYTIVRVDQQTLKIIFKPSTECIAKVMQTRKENEDNICLIDLRLIKVRGTRCCNDETHSEMGRFYISGYYDFCIINNHPKVINYENVVMHEKVVKYVRIQNNSQKVAAKFKYVKVTNYDVVPKRFTIPPNSTKRIQVNFKPSGEGFPKILPFAIRNAYDDCDNHDLDHCENDNFISYTIKTQAKLVYNIKRKAEVQVSSLHLIVEKNPLYTYMGDELSLFIQRKTIANNLYLKSKKPHHESTVPKIKFVSRKEKCLSKLSLMQPVTTQKKIDTYSLLNITLTPFKIKFGRIGVNTYGEQDISIKNDSEFEVAITMLRHNIISYTKERHPQHKIKLKPHSNIMFPIVCFGSTTTHRTGSFDYLIDGTFHKSHIYSLEVSNSMLMIKEPSLTFGMATSEFFITSAPVKIYNNFNIDIDFEWKETNPDTPFQIIPTHGTVSKRSAKICNITYICKSTKAKIYEIELISKGQITKVIPIELTIMTRKCTIKFLQASVSFEDIALNIETIETVKLENSSRELAFFAFLDPSFPGITIEPMSGVIQPKVVINITIKAIIPCLIEFAFELPVKINNKEVITIPVSGNIIEPKLVVYPRNVYMPRVPIDMVTYVPITFQNIGPLRSVVDVVDRKENNRMCETVFQVFISNGYEKLRVKSFFVDPGQSKCVFVKVHDVFIREYDMYIPFRINGLLGPPLASTSLSLEMNYFTKQYDEMYEDNPKVRVKSMSRDITSFRIGGVITVRWIELSAQEFEINYIHGGDNMIYFTMTNVCKYYLHVTIITAKISPNFSLEVVGNTADILQTVSESQIKVELDKMNEVKFCLKFHPTDYGRQVAVAILFLDKELSTPYSNLKFVGSWEKPEMTASIHHIIFPNCYVETEQSRYFTITLALATDLDLFKCMKEEPCLTVNFDKSKILQDEKGCFTVVEVNVRVYCKFSYTRKVTLYFHHECGSGCEVDVYFCYTCCPLTMHSRSWVTLESDPYPYYPLSTQTEYFEYMEKCKSFLERWLYQQGFHRDLHPEIPDTFLIISTAISITPSAKVKGVNGSFLNFIKRVAGPLMKHIHKITLTELKEPFKTVKEIHDTYEEIIYLLRSRGGNVQVLKAKFLLSYDQFVIYMDNVTPSSKSEAIMLQELRSDADLFHRLGKQSWFDLILQTYKVFVMDSCFFDCMCVKSKTRDIVEILMAWYNEHIRLQHMVCRVKLRRKVVTNLISDLSDGIAIMSVLLVYCPFLTDQITLFADTSENDPKSTAINNACLIIEAINEIKLFFPLTVQDFLEPNFLHMLFLSIHLFVLLPTIKPKQNVEFCPPLLKSSTRQVTIYPTTQETLMYSFLILYNDSGCFSVEKVHAPDGGKKIYLNVTFRAKSLKTETAYLLIQGCNKARIFDTYLMFNLIGKTGALIPFQKCKVTGLLYRPSKVDISLSSPFVTLATFDMFITDIEPCLPVDFEELKSDKRKFCVRRLNLIDKEIMLLPRIKESPGTDDPEVKIYLQIICLSTLPASFWIWFRSEIGEFFIRIMTNCRSDMPVETFQVKLKSWPIQPCCCGDSCECDRSSVIMIPHRNDLMHKALRCALLEHANNTIMEIYDQLIVSATGQMILLKLLSEGGTNISDIEHILQPVAKYRITSKTILPQMDHVTLDHHTDAMLALPVTTLPNEKTDKYIITFVSETGADIRNYKIVFILESSME